MTEIQSARERPLYVPPKTAAWLLGIGRTKLYELLHSGALPSYKLGARRLIKLADLEAYADTLKDPRP